MKFTRLNISNTSLYQTHHSPVHIGAHAVGDVGQAVDGAALAAAALEVLDRALVVHEHRHHLVGLRDHLVERDLARVVVDVVQDLCKRTRVRINKLSATRMTQLSITEIQQSFCGGRKILKLTGPISTTFHGAISSYRGILRKLLNSLSLSECSRPRRSAEMSVTP